MQGNSQGFNRYVTVDMFVGQAFDHRRKIPAVQKAYTTDKENAYSPYNSSDRPSDSLQNPGCLVFLHFLPHTDNRIVECMQIKIIYR